MNNVSELVDVSGEFKVQIVDDIILDSSGDLKVTISDSLYTLDCTMDSAYKRFVQDGLLKCNAIILVKSLMLDFKSRTFTLRQIRLLKETVDKVLGNLRPFHCQELDCLRRT